MNGQLVQVSFAQGSRTLPARRGQATLVCALRGTGRLRAADTTCELDAEAGALAVVNAGEAIELAVSPKGLALICTIDLRTLGRLTNSRAIRFFCDPSLARQERYAELRFLVDALVRAQVQRDDFAALHREEAGLTLVRCLLDGFAVAPSEPPSRAEQFCSYIDARYDEPITQAEAARHFHLSPEHFARAFKQETGETFHAYLTGVRLETAQLLLASSDHTVARIALDAGFPNIAAFNQAFKRAHGRTPSAWRADHGPAPAAAGPRLSSLEPEAFAEAAGAAAQARIDLQFNAKDRTAIAPSWGDMLAVGTPATLAMGQAREQVRWLYEQLGCRYARLVCVPGDFADTRSQHRLEEGLDFLLGLGAAIHAVLEVQPGTNASACAKKFGYMLRRCSNRYSVQNVRSWRFELRPTAGLAADSHEFIALFARIHALLQQLGVHRPLIGPGVLLDAGANTLRGFLRAARARELELGGVTIACRQAVPTGASPGDYVRTADRLFLRNQVLLASEVLAEEGVDPGLLMVGGWSNSLEMRNLMNDACARGADLCQSLLSCAGLAQSVCYDWASDLACTVEGDPEAYRPLSGKPGLLTRDGIPKPAYHALAFLSNLNSGLIEVSDRFAASTNEMGNYQIVCHNCERLGARYLTTPESALVYEEMPSYFEDPRPRTACVRIQGAKPGTYLVKKRFVNAAGGSVLDASARMNLWCMDDPGRSELVYLRAASQPQMQLETVLSSDGTIVFEHELASNEIAYFHVIILY